jgi:micrococcal nuclease
MRTLAGRATLGAVKGLAAVGVLTIWAACSGADAEPSPAPSSAQPTAAVQPPAGAATLRVRQVIDGDTITVSGVGTVRLIGVDAPEKTGGYRESEPYGDAATRFMRALLDGKLVRLEYDGERKDPYNRTLAYVFLEDGTLANEAIIRAGFAETYRRFDYRLKPRFQAAEREARDARRGMWARRTPRP